MKKYKDLIFFDTETTGAGQKDRLLQIALANQVLGTQFVELITPPTEIKSSAKAIHHITEDDLSDAAPFGQSDSKTIISEAINDGKIFVAHNAAFDVEMLRREGITLGSYICTYRIARHIWKDLSSHSLQFLRYEKGLKVDLMGLAPHDALADVLVLEELFKLLRKELTGDDDAAISQMIKMTQEPILMSSLPFGKYKGKPLEDVLRTDGKYLNWLMSVTEDKDVRASILALTS